MEATTTENMKIVRKKYVSSTQLQPGMEIDHDIIDRLGRTLITRGTILNENTIRSLEKFGIDNIYIHGEDVELELDEKTVSPEAKKNIEKLRTSDRSKVTLSDNVRKQVAEGIQSIYNTSDLTHLTDTTNNIANMLLTAIDTNDAMAIDINELKTSDEYTFKHSVDVATIAMILAKQQRWPKKKIYEIGIAGLLHDVGKTRIPPEILNKPGKLDANEFAVMKNHALFSYQIVESNEQFSTAIKHGILQHHEKINGSGYPMGVQGKNISEYAKILAIADIYDALITARPYKPAYSQRDAVEIILSMTPELDLDAMKSFMDSMILYPVDTIVELSNGEKARVVKNTPQCILRPTVVGLSSGKVYELGTDLSCASVIIL